MSDRGIYDVEVDVTDVLTGVTFTKRINKLITVTPALAPVMKRLSISSPTPRLWVEPGAGL
ncbi:hypothetical protein NXV89_15680 [Bacteroides uniformis]|nr:hypothetical protein [Bacteroides uniformis]